MERARREETSGFNRKNGASRSFTVRLGATGVRGVMELASSPVW